MRRLTIFFLALIPLCAPAHAAELRDGDELLRYCTATIGAYVNYCYGYLDAVADQMLARHAIAGFESCVPSAVNDSELRFALIAFLKENPWSAKLGASEVVARALSARFPCR